MHHTVIPFDFSERYPGASEYDREMARQLDHLLAGIDVEGRRSTAVLVPFKVSNKPVAS